LPGKFINSLFRNFSIEKITTKFQLEMLKDVADSFKKPEIVKVEPKQEPE